MRTVSTNRTTIVVLPQPSALPRISAKTSRKRAALNVAAPSQSIFLCDGSFDSSTFARVTNEAAIPIGTFTKKIHSHPNESVRTPPASGPIATAPPIVAPHTPNAVARSLP